MKLKIFALLFMGSIALFAHRTTLVNLNGQVSLFGTWAVNSMQVIDCPYANNTNFEGVENNCYQFADNYLCRKIKWKIEQDSSIIISTDDYYPQFDSTLINTSRIKSKLVNKEGQLQLCDSLQVNCSSILLKMLGDTLVFENNEICMHKFKLIKI